MRTRNGALTMYLNPLQLYENSTSTFKQSLFQLYFADRRDLLESLSEEFTSLDSFVEWCTTNYPENDSEAPTSSSKEKRI